VITPDQYNDMHTALSGTFTYNGHNFTGDSAQIAQGDNFCSIVVPEIMASPVYQAGHAAIILWTDETEGSNQNDFNHTLLEIAISPYCKGNAYDSTLNYTHSSDLATMQEIFGLTAATPTGYLNDAANYSNATPTGTVGLSQQVGSQYTTSTGTWNGAAGKFTGTAFTNAASPTGGFGTGLRRVSNFAPRTELHGRRLLLQPQDQRLLADGYGDEYAQLGHHQPGLPRGGQPPVQRHVDQQRRHDGGHRPWQPLCERLAHRPCRRTVGDGHAAVQQDERQHCLHRGSDQHRHSALNL
jgi:hypothetical protein